MDNFGAGSSQLNTYLDASISGTVNVAALEPNDHGYHVAGILAGSYGGDNSTAGMVTGMFPDRSNLHIIDFSNNLTLHDGQVKALLEARSFGGTVVMNTSLGIACQSITFSGTCREKETAMQEGVMWTIMVRAAGMDVKNLSCHSGG